MSYTQVKTFRKNINFQFIDEDSIQADFLTANWSHHYNLIY